VLFSIGLILVSMASARLVFGDQAARVFLPDYLRGQLHFVGRDFPTYRVFIIVFSVLTVFGLWFGVERTRWGAMVRPRSTIAHGAVRSGINTRLLFMLTFALGSGLAGLGGALGADILPVQWAYPFEHLVYFLIVVAVGGLGTLRGPFIAALLIGIADTACKYWIPEFGAFLVYAATIAILLWRPHGSLRDEGVSGYTVDARIRWTEWIPFVVALAGFFLLPEYLALGSRILIFILFALSLDLILGYAGIVNPRPQRVSASVRTPRASSAPSLGVTDPFIQLSCSAIAAAILGVATGAIILRTRALTLLMLTARDHRDPARGSEQDELAEPAAPTACRA
jgi:ABC-type branched-subunit amino acid transport system permease subunit